ncbi:MAG: hypothetical protein BRD55_03205 [Bacteroidetes bacterium SW_9_63_38]|nr:MAG: hypothetical protein BRD55_03205 [Bacteroidetes bacterium SW_9_63_38]
MTNYNSSVCTLKSSWGFLPVLVLGAFFFTGCAQVQTPAAAGLYTDTKGPVAVGDNNVQSAKTGKASATSILGIIAQGDASIKKAAEQGGISKIHHVDYQSKSYLGLYGKYTVVVYGE